MLNISENLKTEIDFVCLSGIPAAAGKKASGWDCLLSETVIGDFLIVPLNSAEMLKHESDWMQNPCEEYAALCRAGSEALFSVCSCSGQRLATLALQNNMGCWNLDYCAGPAGSEILEERFVYLDDEDVLQTECYPTEIYYVVQEVLRLINTVDAERHCLLNS